MNGMIGWAKGAAFPALLALLLGGAGARADGNETIDRALRTRLRRS